MHKHTNEADKDCFKNQVVFISGGGTGIGAAVARQMAEAGAKLVLMGRRTAPLQQMAAALAPADVLLLSGDAANAADVRQAVAQASERFGGIDVLVANAGGHGLGKLTDTDDASWAQATRLNLDTAFVCARELMPELLKRRGNIVILSSLAGHFAGPEVLGYVTMKHALLGLTRSLARDYGPLGVRVNAVCPGWVRTAMADEQMQVLIQKHGLRDTEAAYRLVSRHVPMRRPAEAAEVADAVLFLASGRAAMITGSSLMVDGGASAVDLPTIAFAD
ncbi:NAD(P)-dependent dehydrogenase (short-subunit alcohol dehydrogenase family) [Paucibacter oligotrophus]|uniref:NAD(P)-dependent dehydrogenase (Short-subunit alcohol dehydrogenase family) n=1 Tax=Roseateles oligotrophus TaxID=1769250 RepID=A0A840LEI5_9BURK|nr:SDR family oxidoreductase [Roseateles oligotrophus]MBB4845052.1 NAD(P)-dependent dehydrogenase (short-subunit alcohol dehydrogenase family) [Roseateles oligotrophus]